MFFWIDATQPAASTEIFGLTLLERHLRIIRNVLELKGLTEKRGEEMSAREAQMIADFKRSAGPDGAHEIRIELASGSPIPDIRARLGSDISLTWSASDAPLGLRLRTFAEDVKGAAIVGMSAECEIDERIVTHLASRKENCVFVSGQGSERSAAFRVREGAIDIDPDADDISAIAESLVQRADTKQIDGEKMDGYIPKLRRTLAPYLIKITDDQVRDETESFLFHSNYKGATDFLTKHVYPPLVWRMTKPLARLHVHPNWVTIVSIIATFGAVPLFATGQWVPGIALAFIMSVLDSVDGKLARVTFTSSPQGNLLDHGTDLIHPPIWYFGWAWGLSGGDPFSGVFEASVWMMGLYVFDRMLERLFSVCTGRSVQDFRPLDVKLRTFSSRRNVNLAIFVVALPFGLGIPAFYLIVAWQALTAAYHFVRVIQFWDGNPDEEEELEGHEEGLDAVGPSMPL
ncbi:MAG: hypothetical protein GY944_14695 [bacterium]|nr:hypothetical protein [bacterium]